jgi:cell wall-associated NlpC family hydrolase
MSKPISGRHRGQNRLSRASTLSAAISRTTKPAAKASAVFAISGGLVASFALPASAAPSVTLAKAKAPAVSAPLAFAPSTAATPFVSPSFGDIGFEGVVKPKPVVVHVVARPAVHHVTHHTSRVTFRASRSSARLPVHVRVVRAAAAPAPAPAPAPPRTGGVIGIAASLAGTPYVYGGTTTSGFDCSGFTQYVFGKVGISLPRTSQAQQASATHVSTPQVGDLVFFGVPAYHVGIYAGNGMMWDSPHTGSVVKLQAVFGGASYGRV